MFRCNVNIIFHIHLYQLHLAIGLPLILGSKRLENMDNFLQNNVEYAPQQLVNPACTELQKPGSSHPGILGDKWFATRKFLTLRGK